MKKTSSTPFWVFLAYANIETRKGALILLWSSIAFSFYCIPWPNYFNGDGWVAKLFLIDDWSWFAMMLPMTAWYWLSLKWMDKNGSW
jgi:hypothetical protein